MKQGWLKKDFEKCIEKVPNTFKVPKKKFLDEGSFPIISQEESFINGYWNDESAVLNVKKPVVLFGDHTKIVKLVDFDFVRGADGVKVLLPIESLDSKFFAYQLKSLDIRDLGYARHYRLLKEKKISIPPLEEQKQIVKILDEAFEAIDQAQANIEKNIENAQELFQSKLNDIFSQKGEGWEEKDLEELIDIKHGYAFKSRDFETDFNGENPIVLTPGNFNEDSTLYFNSKNTKRLITDYPKDYLFNNGDLVVVMTDLSSKMKILGKPAIIEARNILHNQRIGRIVFKDDDLDTEFLYYYFQTSQYLNNIKESATGAMVKHTAPKRILSNRLSYLTSKEKQKNIVLEVQSLKTQTLQINTYYQKKLSNLEELKKSILDKAFAGELTNKVS